MRTEPVAAELLKYRLLKQRLVAEYPSADEETLADTLEGITDLREKIGRAHV